MNKKRSIVLMTVLALVCLMLGGCKGSDAEPAQTGDTTATEAPAEPTEAPAEPTEAPAATEPAVTEAPTADVDRSTIYVDAASGNDENTGDSKEAAFASIAKAVEVAEPGSEILVASGTYTDKIYFEVSGTADERITLKAADPANRPLLTAGEGWSDDDFDDGFIVIEDASFITIEGFEIAEYKTTSEDPCPIGIHVCGDSDGVIIKDCYIHDCGIINPGTDYNAHGILVSGDSKGAINDITVEDCELCNLSLGNSEALVLNGNVDGFIVRNNVVHDNDNIGIDFIGYEETYSDPTFDRARNGECTGNTVYNITSEFNPTYEGDICADGIYVDGGDNIVIKDNVVYNCDIGIETASEHQGRSTSNIVID
ncbi:MAG: right-handed parallel beta-helix repeat-containing protein, partial [Lachnospiraceae bacterium]|nr:right-handed parallel beta-helix repeat-containing protein [Lachnospiraceae bacterium]